MAKFLGRAVALALEKMSSRSQYCSGMGVSLEDGSKEALGMPLSTRGVLLEEHEARQSGCLRICLSTNVTGRISCLSL